MRLFNRALKRRFPKAKIFFVGYPCPYSEQTLKFSHFGEKIPNATNDLIDYLNNYFRGNVAHFASVSFAKNGL